MTETRGPEPSTEPQPKLVSPVLTLLGGSAPQGMVCGVDGVCTPADSSSTDDDD